MKSWLVQQSEEIVKLRTENEKLKERVRELQGAIELYRLRKEFGGLRSSLDQAG